MQKADVSSGPPVTECVAVALRLICGCGICLRLRMPCVVGQRGCAAWQIHPSQHRFEFAQLQSMQRACARLPQGCAIHPMAFHRNVAPCLPLPLGPQGNRICTPHPPRMAGGPRARRPVGSCAREGGKDADTCAIAVLTGASLLLAGCLPLRRTVDARYGSLKDDPVTTGSLPKPRAASLPSPAPIPLDAPKPAAPAVAAPPALPAAPAVAAPPAARLRPPVLVGRRTSRRKTGRARSSCRVAPNATSTIRLGSSTRRGAEANPRPDLCRVAPRRSRAQGRPLKVKRPH